MLDFQIREPLSSEQRFALARSILVDEYQKPLHSGAPLPSAYELTVLIDALLDLRVEEISARIGAMDAASLASIYGSEKILAKHPAPLMFTPYHTICAVLEKLAPKPGETFIDMGSGFGRLGFAIALLYPGVRFLGYEIVRERVAEAQRVATALELPTVQFFEANVSELSPNFPPAEYYFIYDSFSPKTLEKTLAGLKCVARERNIQIAVNGIYVYKRFRSVGWLQETFVADHGAFAIFSAMADTVAAGGGFPAGARPAHIDGA